MRTVVVLKSVPDLVEELEVNDEGRLEREWLKYKINEFDDHALEEALALKEEQGAEVVAVALDGPEVEEILFTALAKGADRAVLVKGDFPEEMDNHTAASLLAPVVRDLSPDLVLTGVQGVDDLDGQLPILLAMALSLPHVSVVRGITAGEGGVTVLKEFAGGLVMEIAVDGAVVLGVQAARVPPRYAPVSRVRQARKTQSLDEAEGSVPAGGGSGLTLRRLFAPEQSGRAEMLEGEPEEVAARIFAILAERGLVKE